MKQKTAKTSKSQKLSVRAQKSLKGGKRLVAAPPPAPPPAPKGN